MATDVKRATLFKTDPKTGKVSREEVDVTNQRSIKNPTQSVRDLFGQGYKLETNISNAPQATRDLAMDTHAFNAGPTKQQGAYIPGPNERPLNMGGTPQQATQDPYLKFNDILTSMLQKAQTGGTTNDLEAQRNALIAARYKQKTDIRPADEAMLSPEQRNAIRSGETEGLNTQLAGIKTAMAGRKEEQENALTMIELARNINKDSYNMAKGADSAAAKLGQFIFQNVSNFDSLIPADQQTVADNLGISVESLRAMGASAKNQLAQEALADKQANTQFKQSMDLANLALKTPRGSSVTVLNTTVEGLKPLKTASGTSTSYKISQDFQSDLDRANAALRAGQDWGSVWNNIRMNHPEASNEMIRAGLDTRFEKAGAYQEFISGKSQSQSEGTAAGKGTNSLDELIANALAKTKK